MHYHVEPLSMPHVKGVKKACVPQTAELLLFKHNQEGSSYFLKSMKLPVYQTVKRERKRNKGFIFHYNLSLQMIRSPLADFVLPVTSLTTLKCSFRTAK